MTIDCRGMRCPMPVIQLARRVNDVSTRHVIAVVADDPAARIDIPAWCRMRGHEFVAETADSDGTPSYLVRRLV